MKLEYYRKGDYLFPNLTLEGCGEGIGKYGMLRRSFLKEHKSGWYQSLLLTGKLDGHLQEVEQAANARIEVLMDGLLKNHPAPDKEADPLAWAGQIQKFGFAEKSQL